MDVNSLDSLARRGAIRTCLSRPWLLLLLALMVYLFSREHRAET